MTNPDHSPNDDAFLRRAIETTIRIGVVALLAAWCFQITMPFIIPIVWGIIIATAVYPGFRLLESALGERRRLAATDRTRRGLTWRLSIAAC